MNARRLDPEHLNAATAAVGARRVLARREAEACSRQLLRAGLPTLLALLVWGAILAGTAAECLAQAKPRPDPTRYTAQWTDGTRLAGEMVGPWHETKALPKLAVRELFDPARPVLTLVDNSLPVAPPADSMVEIVGGDCLPGRVIGFDDGTERVDWRRPPHLMVAPAMTVDWPDGRSRPHLRITLPWLKRIVWQRVTDRYAPRTVFLPDGRQIGFRSMRFSARGIQLLREDGIRELSLGEVAELHFPPVDCWDACFEQLAGLGPDPAVRLTRWETTTGLRVTGTTERFQARSHGPAEQPANWYHLIQPAWSLDPIWVRHETIRVRAYFLAHEVPLTRIEPSAARGESDLGGVWPWRAERNVESGALESGGGAWPWGFGVHAPSELEFPLPASARWFRTRLGLDHLAGSGGCVKARVLLGPAPGRPLFESNWIIGSSDVSDTGPLKLSDPPGATGRLVLQVDAAHAGRPAGADPLDVRDSFDWLEPLVVLDPEAARLEMLRRSAQQIAAWNGWTAHAGRVPDSRYGVRLANWWDETDALEPGFRLVTALAQEPLRLSGKLLPRPYRDQLLLAVSRPPQAPASKLEVCVEGLPVAQFEIPARGSDAVRPLVVSLAAYHHREVSVELVQHSQDDKALVEWRAISLVNRTAVP